MECNISFPAVGFTFMLGNKDVFVATPRKNRTNALAKKILRELQLPENPDTIREILYYLVPAECEIRSAGNRGSYYSIHGRGFGGRGSFCNDGNTIIISV